MRSAGSRTLPVALGALLASGVCQAALAATAEDYSRADQLRLFDMKSVGGTVSPIGMRDGIRFVYRSEGPGESPGTYYVVDPRTAGKRVLFDSAKVAAFLSKAGGVAVDPAKLPRWAFTPDEKGAVFTLNSIEYLCKLKGSECAAATPKERSTLHADGVPKWAVRSPDGKWDAFIWDHNVYIRPAELSQQDPDLRTASPEPRSDYHEFGAALESSLVDFVPAGQRQWCDSGVPSGERPSGSPEFVPPPSGSIALTTDGAAMWSYGPRWRGVAEVATLESDRYRPTHGSFAWSPDSRKLLTRREDIRGVRIFPLYSSSGEAPIDHSYYYALPGDKSVPQYELFVLDIDKRSSTQVALSPIGVALRPGAAEWSEDSRSLYILSSDRGPQEVRLSRVDADSGAATPIISETSSTYVEMSNGDAEPIVAVSHSGEDLIWFSQRDGWGHLYRYSADGRLKNQLEKGSYSVAQLIWVDAKREQVYFTAWGKEPGIPYYRHFYRVNFDGSELLHLTPEPGDHSIRRIGQSDFFLDTMSTVDRPPVTVVRRSDGSQVMELAHGDDAPLRRIGWRAAETFTVKARDEVTDLYGVMYRPSNFDPAKRYPIIVNIYPGPFRGSVELPWSFQGTDSEQPKIGGNARITHGEGMGQSLADLGFVVIKLDALGSAQRSKAMADFSYGNLIDNGLADNIAAIKQLATRYPWVDADRVGIFGHSGGGYAAAAGMLRYPEFFKVGVSEAGDHDLRGYAWYWGEKYQGPLATAADADAYAAQANSHYAKNLKGKLLLIHGDMDCNVAPAQTLRLADALIKEQKDFDMLIVPDAGHQLPSYAMRRAWDYFVRNLQGEEPPVYSLIQ